jgi:hypothetical protein
MIFCVWMRMRCGVADAVVVAVVLGLVVVVD